MNKRELVLKRRKTWFKYHIPSMSNLHRIKKNAVFLSSANKVSHELGKALTAFLINKYGQADMNYSIAKQLLSVEREVTELTKDWEINPGEFITEAERNLKKGNPRVRRDVVCLDTEEIYELETDKTRAKRHGKDVNVLKLFKDSRR